VDLTTLDFAGSLFDPVAALVFCTPVKSAYTCVGGKLIVRDGHITTVNLQDLILNHNRLAAGLLED
jgi:hypothetical protein